MTKRSSKWVTAGELLAELERDPDFQRDEAERETTFRRRQEELRADERGLVNELRNAGLRLDSVWDLVAAGEGRSPTQATTILIRHLGERHQASVRSGIAMALATSPAADRHRAKLALIQALATESEDSVRDDIVLAIAQVADDLDGLIDLLNDPAIGDARLVLLSELSRFGERGRAALRAATSDPFLGREATRQLRAMAKGGQRTHPDAAPLDNELVSIALDRDRLPALLSGLVEALGVSPGSMRRIIPQVDRLLPGEGMSATVRATAGRSVSLEFLMDDFDALIVVVRGPESMQSTLEQTVEDLPLER